MDAIDEHIPITKSPWRPERVVSVLVSDWNDLKQEIDEIGESNPFWGHTASAVLGFGISTFLGTWFYHLGVPSPSPAALGVGYTLGPILGLGSIPLFLLERNAPKRPELSKKALNKLTAKIESKQTDDSGDVPVPARLPTSSESLLPSSVELKSKAFTSILTRKDKVSSDG